MSGDLWFMLIINIMIYGSIILSSLLDHRERIGKQLAELASKSGNTDLVLVDKLVTGYHEQAMRQANWQFYFSLAMGTAGFAWIMIAGSWITADAPYSVLRVTPGVLIDALALLFYRQSEQTRQRATELYDRLRKDHQLAESQNMTAGIENPFLKSAVQAYIALQMAGIATSPIDIPALMKSVVSATSGSSGPSRAKSSVEIVKVEATK